MQIIGSQISGQFMPDSAISVINYKFEGKSLTKKDYVKNFQTEFYIIFI